MSRETKSRLSKMSVHGVCVGEQFEIIKESRNEAQSWYEKKEH